MNALARVLGGLWAAAVLLAPPVALGLALAGSVAIAAAVYRAARDDAADREVAA